MALTATRPLTQPTANAGPAVRAFAPARTRTTATIGIGLSATASAAGSRSPMASFNNGLQYPRDPPPYLAAELTASASAQTDAARAVVA